MSEIYHEIFLKYTDNIFAYVFEIPIFTSGIEEPPDERFMEEIERNCGIMPFAREIFREHIVQQIGRNIEDGKRNNLNKLPLLQAGIEIYVKKMDKIQKMHEGIGVPTSTKEIKSSLGIYDDIVMAKFNSEGGFSEN